MDKLQDLLSDNDQLREANRVLHESEERLAVTLNSIGDAVIVTDENAFVVRLNPVAEELTGWPIKDAYGKPIKDIFNIINQETRIKSTIPVMATLSEGVIQGLANHTILISRHGREMSISDSCAPIRDYSGEIIGAILVFRDVTKTYEIEQALHDSATRIKVILDTLADGVITFDPDQGIIVNNNPAVETMFGYTCEELTGLRLTELIPELDNLKWQSSIEYYRLFEQDRINGVAREVSGLKKNHAVFLIDISFNEMKLGDTVFFTAILRDISLRRQAEADLRKANALQSAIFHSATFSYIATDAKGVIQIFNIGAEEMLGYKAEEVVNIITPEKISDSDELIARAQTLSDELSMEISPGFEALVFKASRGIEDIYELTYVRKDGSRFPAVVSITALKDAEERIIGYLLIGTDNTARKAIEEEKVALYRQLEERNDDLQIARIIADKANNAKTDFLSSMSHELRTPLSAVLGFAQLIDSGTPPPTQSQKRSVDQILKAGWYLLDLINEILDLSLIDAGKLSLSIEHVSINEVLRECQEMFAIQAEKRNIRMEFILPEFPCFVRADRTRLKQIFINLLSNSIKYNRENGSVTVEMRLTDTKSVQVSIRDTGAGLSPEQVGQLFEPFNRLGQENIAEEGTGIGLVLSKRLIEMMGGIIGVDSKEDEGSTFWVEIDLIADYDLPSKNETPSADGESDMSAPKRIITLLYIEDNQANLMLIEDIIARRDDIKLISSNNGIRGVEMAIRVIPDLILMDINLPGLNGIDALKQLQKNPATAHIPIIALSSNAVPRDIERGLEAGFFKYLTKPIMINEFLRTLNLAIEKIEGTDGSRR